MRSVRDERWKLICYPPINHVQLFDLQSDPHERHNLAADPRHAARVKELTGLIAVLEAISLGVGALFLVSTLALSYLDRRGEFATLLAMGYGRRQLCSISITTKSNPRKANNLTIATSLDSIMALPRTNSLFPIFCLSLFSNVLPTPVPV